MMGRIVDLSHAIDGDVPMFPGHPRPAVEVFLDRETARRHYTMGTSFVIHRYGFVGNTGTYLDSPFHRFADGDDLGVLDLAKTVDVPGVVVDASRWVDAGRFGVGIDELGDTDVRGRAVLLRTGWDRRWPSPAYLEAKPFLMAEGAQRLTERGAVLVGIDTWNIDDVADRSRPAHSVLLRGSRRPNDSTADHHDLGSPRHRATAAAPFLIRHRLLDSAADRCSILPASYHVVGETPPPSRDDEEHMPSDTTNRFNRPDLVDELVQFLTPPLDDVIERIDAEEFTTVQFIDVLQTDPDARAAYEEALRRWGEDETYSRMVVHGQVIPTILRRSQRLEWAGFAHGESDPFAVPAWWRVK